jgi:hypothetical protein
MIKADVYYRAESDQLVIVLPVYVLQNEIGNISGNQITLENYLPIGYAVDNGEIIFILGFEGLKHFEYLGEL